MPVHVERKAILSNNEEVYVERIRSTGLGEKTITDRVVFEGNGAPITISREDWDDLVAFITREFTVLETREGALDGQ